MGRDARDSVFAVFHQSEFQTKREIPCSRFSIKVSFKPSSSATETSYKNEVSLVASLDMILSNNKANNKGAVQTVRMHRLVCASVVR